MDVRGEGTGSSSQFSHQIVAADDADLFQDHSASIVLVPGHSSLFAHSRFKRNNKKGAYLNYIFNSNRMIQYSTFWNVPRYFGYRGSATLVRKDLQVCNRRWPLNC